MVSTPTAVELVVKVDVEDSGGDSECLEWLIRKGQSIPEVAREFCEENGIAPGLQYLLEKHLHSSLAILKSQTERTPHRTSIDEDEMETPTLKDLNMRLEQRLSRIATLRHVLKDSENADQVARVRKILKTLGEEGAGKGVELQDDKRRNKQCASETRIHSLERLQSLDDLFKVHRHRREGRKSSSPAGSELSDWADELQQLSHAPKGSQPSFLCGDDHDGSLEIEGKKEELDPLMAGGCIEIAKQVGLVDPALELRAQHNSIGRVSSPVPGVEAKSPTHEKIKSKPTRGPQSSRKADLGSSPLRTKPSKRAPSLMERTVEQIQQELETQIAKLTRHPPSAERIPDKVSSGHLRKGLKVNGAKGTYKEEGKPLLAEGEGTRGEKGITGSMIQNSQDRNKVERSKPPAAVNGAGGKTGSPGRKLASAKGMGPPVKQAGSIGISDPTGIIHGLKKHVNKRRQSKIHDKTSSPSKVTEQRKHFKSPNSSHAQSVGQVTECSVPLCKREGSNGHRTYQEIQEECEIGQALESKGSNTSLHRPASRIINDSFTKLTSIFDEPQVSKRGKASLKEQEASWETLSCDLTPENFERRVLVGLKASLEEAKQEAQVGIQDLLQALASNTEQRKKIGRGTEDQPVSPVGGQEHIDSVIKELRRAMLESEKGWEKESINVGTLGKVIGTPSPQRFSLKAFVDPTILYEDNGDEEADGLSFSKFDEGASKMHKAKARDDLIFDQSDSEPDEDDYSSGRFYNDILRQERDAKAVAKDLIKDLRAEVLGSWR